MFQAATTGRPVDPNWVVLFKEIWQELPHTISWSIPEPKFSAAADASDAGLGIRLQQGNVAIIVPNPRGIYVRELTAVCLAA